MLINLSQKLTVEGGPLGEDYLKCQFINRYEFSQLRSFLNYNAKGETKQENYTTLVYTDGRGRNNEFIILNGVQIL